jgi:hypothetical protein
MRPIPVAQTDNDQVYGTNEFEFYTVCTTKEASKSNNYYTNGLFNNLTFYKLNDDTNHIVTTNSIRYFSNVEICSNINNIFEFNNIEDTKSIVDTLHVFEKNNPNFNPTLVKVNYKMEISEVNTYVDNFELYRQWTAMSKLTKNDIKVLGLEKQYTILKLKFG